MFKNYLKTALRNILRHKGYSLINIVGLAVGLACFLLIVFYVRFERSYDDFHKNKKDIYLVVRYNTGENYQEVKANTGAPLAPLLVRNFPDIENAVRFTSFRGELVSRGQNRFIEKRFFFADESVFKVFTYPLARGDEDSALREPLTMVLTQETARKYFGAEDPVGQVLNYNLSGRSFDFRVTGVLKPVPRNTQLEFDFLASYASLKPVLGGNADYFLTKHWDSLTLNFVKLRTGADPEALNKQLPAFTEKYVDKWSYTSISHRLQPLSDLYFHGPGPFLGPHGSSQFVLILSVIAFFILLIACINFMNLATARSESRSREIGVRKVVGGAKLQLVTQFLGESLVFSFLSLVLAAGLVELLRPAFSGFVGKDIVINYGRDLGFLAIMVLTAAGVGVLSGAYPAFVLASLRPYFILKQAKSAGRGAGLTVRKVLVVGQFVMSIVLICTALLMGQQVRLLKSMDVGFNKQHVIVIPVRDNAAVKQYEALKAEWLQNTSVIGVTASSMEPGVTDQNGINLRGRGNADTEMGIIYVDNDYMKTMGVAMAAGRDFSRLNSTDAVAGLLINEAALKHLGWTDGVGEPAELYFKQGGKIVPMYQTAVVGVAKDFHFRDLTVPVQPVLFKIDPGRFDYFLIRLAGSAIPQTIASVRKTWEGFAFNQPFEFRFLEDDMNAVYQTYTNFAWIAAFATGLAILIASLGLFGLAAYAIEKRIKEIGIRRVLGASLAGLVLMLSKDFLKLVLIANIIAWPLAFYGAKVWLQWFAYKISIGLGTFVLAGTLALVIALVTVGVQAIKAGLDNPVDSIRYE